jgi:hypothetical protein
MEIGSWVSGTKIGQSPECGQHRRERTGLVCATDN